MKKNFIWSMFAIIMVTMLSVSLSACGSDDEEDGANSVVGTWYRVEEGGSLREIFSLTFKSNGTGSLSVKYEYQGEEPYTVSTSFTYTSISNTKGTITGEEYDSYGTIVTMFCHYVIIGNKMRVYEDGYEDDYVVYTKQ